MFVDFLIDKMQAHGNNQALVTDEASYTYSELLNTYHDRQIFIGKNIAKGEVVAIRSGFSPDSISLLLALIENGNIIVPFAETTKNIEELMQIGRVGKMIDLLSGEAKLTDHVVSDYHDHPLIQQLRDAQKPGIIIFSSGTSGKPKAALNDFAALLNKFKLERKSYRTINFLLFDHWGGINTMLHIISNAGMLLVTADRSPENICMLIEKHKIELLPTTPTFLNMLLISEAYNKHDLSSLKLITYGTEMMNEITLKRIHTVLPQIDIKQTYGLTELGVLRTISRGKDNLWLKVGGEDYQTKILDGVLFIKAKTTMLGYLNAAAPIDSDGWYDTGDCVETDGEWIRFTGRKTEIINVGGQKVLPAVVESSIMEMPEVADCSVYGEKNIITGQIVAADILLKHPVEKNVFSKLLRAFLKDKLEPYKIPVKINIVDNLIMSDRFKKIRKPMQE
jgi:long-chain acyl-CoA synthetase